jgi:5-methylcytosine-specific restriction protein A
MTRGGRRDAEVWDRYHDRPGELRAIASRLRAGVEGTNAFPVVPEEDEDEVPEGRLLYRLHRSRERNRNLIARKKARARASGALTCEVCGFDFESAYGPLGRDFIECHHVRPLSDSGTTRTKLTDLALLCANCHRMAHRGQPWPSLPDLSELVHQQARRTLVPGVVKRAGVMSWPGVGGRLPADA